MPELTTLQLKEIAGKIVLSQGNKFIKELLRKNDVKIGKNKEEFLVNLHQGIDDGFINQAKIDAWLSDIEGWGNQHVYLFELPPIEKDDLEAVMSASPYSAILEDHENYEFPEDLALKTASLNDTELSLGWREGKDSWVRSQAKDYRQELEGDEYEFRAYREKSERKIARFVWEFGKPFCAVYITHPNEHGVHEQVLAQVWADLNTFAVTGAPLQKISLSSSFSNLNQKPELKVNSVKLNVDGGHVNLVATAPQTGIHDIEAIRQAQIGIDANQFSSSDGIFHFNEENLPGLSKQVKVEGSGTDSRIRIWAQCTREDVGLIVNEVDASR
jgi:hypothetical protein